MNGNLKNILLFFVVVGFVWFFFFRNDASCDFISKFSENSEPQTDVSSQEKKSGTVKKKLAPYTKSAGIAENEYGKYLKTFILLKKKGGSVEPSEVTNLISNSPDGNPSIIEYTAEYFYLTALRSGNRDLYRTASNSLSKADADTILSRVSKVKCTHCRDGNCRSCNGKGRRRSDGFEKNASGRGMHFTQDVDTCGACSGSGKCRYCEKGFIHPVLPDMKKSAVIDKNLCCSEAAETAERLEQTLQRLSRKN